MRHDRSPDRSPLALLALLLWPGALFAQEEAAPQTGTETLEKQGDELGDPLPERDPTVPSSELSALFPETLGRPANAAERVVSRVDVGEGDRFVEVEFANAPLAAALRELVQAGSGWNVLASSDVAERAVDLYLEDVTLEDAVQLLAASNGLVVRRDPERRVLRLIPAERYEVDLDDLRSDTTRVFTLLYPNAIEVAEALANVYGQRVTVSFGDSGQETFRELELRFDRFDLIDGRSQGLGGTFGGGTSVNRATGARGGTFNTGAGFQTGARRVGANQNRNQQAEERRDDELRESLSVDQLQTLEDELAAGAVDGSGASVSEQIASRATSIYVTVLRRLNRIVVRSHDARVVEEIGDLIRRLDVPTPLVMLEVRILRVELDDGMTSAFDFAGLDGDAAGSFSRGEILPPAAGSLLPGGTGFNARAGVFQAVGDHFAARLEVLQNKGNVTALATPLILTANAEVSRIFSGRRVPLVVGFTEPQIVVGDGATTTLQASPVTELTDVGTQLLLTANINADRTVTMRLLQESSSIVENGATILVPVGGSIEQQTIDVLQTQTSSGTVVGQDGQMVAFGGLIEEVRSDQREQVPLLGDIPILGLLFKREDRRDVRSELVVLVRPYVLDTPMDGDRLSRELLEELSEHPDATTTLPPMGPTDERETLRRSLRFHSLPAEDA